MNKAINDSPAISVGVHYRSSKPLPNAVTKLPGLTQATTLMKIHLWLYPLLINFLKSVNLGIRLSSQQGVLNEQVLFVTVNRSTLGGYYEYEFTRLLGF